MAQNTLEKIEEKIRQNSLLTKENKTELLSLLATLKPQITEFSKTQAEHAESIAGFIERSTYEAMRRQKNPTLLRMAKTMKDSSLVSMMMDSIASNRGMSMMMQKMVHHAKADSTMMMQMCTMMAGDKEMHAMMMNMMGYGAMTNGGMMKHDKMQRE